MVLMDWHQKTTGVQDRDSTGQCLPDHPIVPVAVTDEKRGILTYRPFEKRKKSIQYPSCWNPLFKAHFCNRQPNRAD